jgi:hypothetical protein
VTPFRKLLEGTSYELESHTLGVEITEKDYELFKDAKVYMKSKGTVVKAMIFCMYPEVLLDGWDSADETAIEKIFAMDSDIRLDYCELHLWHDGDILWRYSVKHVDGKHWEAAWVTWKELENYFEPKGI